MEEVMSSKEFPHNVNVLWDLTEMEFDNIDINFQKKLIALRQKRDKQRGTAKLAIVSDYILADPLIKLYTILSADLSQIVKTFRTIEDAQLWLLK